MSISEVKVGSLVRVKVGRNIIPVKVIEILGGKMRVLSIAKNKEFIVSPEKIVPDEDAPAEQKPEPVDGEAVGEEAEPADVGESAAAETGPEDETAEFIPSGDDQEDEYAVNPAHESDKPEKRLSLLNAAVIVLKDAGPDHPMNTREILVEVLERQLWKPTECKTPEQTLYGSIFREISTKMHPRIVKSKIKGKFVIAV